MEENEAKHRIQQMISFVDEEAKEKAREIESKTEHEYNKEKAKHLQNAKDKLNAEYEKKWKGLEVAQRIQKSADITNQRMQILKARNEMVQTSLEDSKISISEQMADDQGTYGRVLTELIVQSLIKLLENDVEIICRETDVDLVESVLGDAASKYSEIMQEETDSEYKVNLSVNRSDFLNPAPERGSNAPSCSGGIVATAHHGKIRVINTLEERLKRVFADSIPKIRAMLFES